MKSNQVKNTKVIVISGPSGSGKTTISKRLVQDIDSLYFVVTHTTRRPRKGEVNGVDYHFISKEKFLALKNENFFIENAKVFGNFYGVSFNEINKNLANEQNILLEIDWQGAKRVREVYDKNCFSIFIQTKDLNELKQRLILRGKDSEKVVEKRIEEANLEISKADEYDIHLINDDLNHTFEKIKSAIIDFID